MDSRDHDRNYSKITIGDDEPLKPLFRGWINGHNIGAVFAIIGVLAAIGTIGTGISTCMHAPVKSSSVEYIHGLVIEQPKLKSYVQERIENDGHIDITEFNDIRDRYYKLKQQEKLDKLKRTLKEH